jgi:hypothetical protein
MLLMLALVLPGVSFAQDKDSQEVSRYVLTDAGLSKYAKAVEGLRGLAGQLSSCDEEGASSIAEQAAAIDRVPAAKAAIQSAGLATREFVVFSFALLQTGMAAWAVEQPGGKLPPGFSQANVDFYKANKARIEKVPALEDGCDDSSDDEEGEESC